MNLNKLISFLSILLILIMLVGVVSATDANSTNNLESINENIAVEHDSAITSSSHGAQGASEVLGAGDSDVLGAGEGTFTELHELIRGKSVINLDKDYKYDPDVDKKYAWNGYEDYMSYSDGVPIVNVMAGLNHATQITINGNGHTIDGNNLARIFNITFLSNTKITFNDINFVNGCMKGGSPEVDGGAIYFGSDHITATFNNCLFENNSAVNTNMGDPIGNISKGEIGTAWGGAIYVSGEGGYYTQPTSLTVNNCVFRGNKANYGGAIASTDKTSLGRINIYNTLFENNSAESHPYNGSNGLYYFNGLYYSHGWGGAVYSYYVTVGNGTFINNKGGNNSGYGGAISAKNADIYDSKFINNSCFKGGALADGHETYDTTGVEGEVTYYSIENSLFDNNTAQLTGGAVLTRNVGGYFFGEQVNYADLRVLNSNFTNNDGGRYGGGAIMASCPTIQNCNFINNTAYNYGGAISAGQANIFYSSFINNSAAHSAACFVIDLRDMGYYTDNELGYVYKDCYFEGNEILPRVLYDHGFTINDTPVQDGKVLVIGEHSRYLDWAAWAYKYWNRTTNPSTIIYNNTAGMNNGIGYYGFDFEVDLYGHAIEYSLNDVKGGYGQVSPGGAEGIVTDDLSYIINLIDGRELKEYIKILYYLCNLDPEFMNGAFRNEEAGELALEFPIKELCFSDLSHPINGLMENITKLYDSGFRVPDNYYKLSDVLKDHIKHCPDVMVPDNADEILGDTTKGIINRLFLYIVPFHHTHYLMYYQTNLTIEKITRNPIVVLGEDVEFEVKVTNGGNYSVSGIFVKDDDYDDGLVFKEYKNSTGKWNYDAETGRYNLEDNNGTLAPRTSKSIIFVFTTTKTGVLNNTATYQYGNATNNTTVIVPDMKVEKITLNKTVYLGNVTMFKIRVTNIGGVNLTNIIVDEVDYDEGLVLTGWKGEYPWFGNIDTKKFVYLDTLKPHESAEFIVIFNTTSIGNKTNYVNASSKQTGNKSANNTTEVVPIRVNITKEWEDKDNQDGIRPESVTVHLLADGVEVGKAILNESNGWTVLFKDLPMVYNRNVINYTVIEDPIDNYTAEIKNITTDDFSIIVANNTYNFTVTNNHTPAVTNVSVVKVWDDADDQDGVRPDGVTVILLADGVKVNETDLSDKNNWTYVFKDLPKFKAGELIKYTVNETVVANYTVNITDDGKGKWTVNNTHVPELVNITVKKNWNDSDNQDGVRPDSVTIELFADGVKVNETTLSEDNKWEDIFKDLPKFKAGELIKYTVNETKVANYTINITDDGKGNWTVNNTHVPEVISIPVIKVWEDNDDYDKVRPDNITVHLFANGVEVGEPISLTADDDWKYTFENLSKYENGELINYTIKEDNVSGYNTTIENFTITNTHIRPNMTVEKITINEVVLLGQETSFTIVVTNTGNVKLSDVTVVEEVPAGLRYDGKFTGKDWYNNGVTFIYNAVLNPGESTSFNITFATVKSGNWTNVVMASSNETENKTANNNTTVIPIVINVTKEWNDSDDQDGIRPGSVTVELFADGVKVNETVLSEDNKWNASFVELPAYKDGKEIVYTIGEVEVDGYDVSVNETNGSFVITNTHVPEVLNITVNKVWNDSDDQDGVRPDGVTVYLLADGVKVNETTLSAKDGWTFTFVGLAVNKDGIAIVYTVEEDDVDKYPIVDIADVGNNTFNVTNTHIPELVNITVKKNWNDSDDQDGVRPDSVTIELFADGVKVNETTLSEDNKWEDIFKDLPKFKAGELIKYTVNETKVANYTINITDDGKGNWTVNNTHVPEVISIPVIKVWEDNDDYDKVRPDNITVHLFANGVEVGEPISLTADDDWKYTFENLSKYENGELINYTIKEDNVSGYNTTIENFTITNTHVRPNMTVVKITLNKTVLVGEETSFTINVTNTGNTDLSDITVVEEVPEGLRYDGKFTGENWYANGNEFIYKDILKPGESAAFNITFTAVKVGDWLNKVNATSNETENKTTNNTTTVLNPGMSVRKISLNESVLLGKQVGFIVVVSNTGNSNLTGVYVVDNDFTEGIVLDHMDPNDDWTFDGKDRFTYGKTLGVGESANFTIWFNTTSTGFKVNNVTAYSNETNKTNSTNNTTVYKPDMSVRKISLNESVILGKQVGFTIVVSNTGDCDLTEVYVVDNDFTEGIVLDSMVPNDDWTFDGKDRFTYGKTLGVGGSANFTVIFNTTSIGSKINNVTAGSNETNETNSTNKTFVYVPDMTVRKISLNESVYLGTPVAFTVVVTNNGTIDLTGVYVIDNDFTEGIVLDHMVPNDNWIFDGKDKFTYVPDVLHVGESANFTIWFNTTSIGDKINNVTADSNETPEVNSTNKTHVYVGNMSVRKISLNESVYLGNQVGFIVVVTNTGDCDLPGVYVVDNDFTEGIVLDHMVPNEDWTFDGKDRFTYNPSVLGVGKSANFTIWFNTTSIGDKINNVTAGNDLTPEVNSTNKTHVYVGDMTVRKISNNKTVKVGEQVSFTIVVKNTGGCDLTGVYVIDDDYTTGLVYDHFVDSTGKWTFEGNGKWTYNDVLGIGEEAQFDVVFNTTSVGFKVNNVTAGNNITNETVNSTNNTTVVNKTVPPEPEPPEPEPPEPEIPEPETPTPEIPGVPNEPVVPKAHATGNPFIAVILALLAMGLIPKRRKQ